MDLSHLFMPDPQVKPKVPLYHLDWIGAYIVKKQTDKIILAGDWADMHSLSSYDKGTKGFEGRSYQQDIRAANDALDRLMAPINEYNRIRRARKEKQYKPEMHITLGNHENRINRVVENQRELEGAISVDDIEFAKHGITVHEFLTPVVLDGIAYAHYFCRSPNGQVMQNRRGAPNARMQVIREMRSCTAGHLQGMDWHPQPWANGIRYGLIAGSCYLHQESYLTRQGENYWRGIVVKRGVKDGEYSPWFVTLDWLCQEYEGKPLSKFMQKIYAVAA